ncbi:hypothetical protein MRB53_040093 [Persea americana]|nr:hypothetical protein MRB53_040093 [Persea americana]
MDCVPSTPLTVFADFEANGTSSVESCGDDRTLFTPADSVDTRATTPELSDSRLAEYKGPPLMPKIRAQDQNVADHSAYGITAMSSPNSYCIPTFTPWGYEWIDLALIDSIGL